MGTGIIFFVLCIFTTVTVKENFVDLHDMTKEERKFNNNTLKCQKCTDTQLFTGNVCLTFGMGEVVAFLSTETSEKSITITGIMHETDQKVLYNHIKQNVK